MKVSVVIPCFNAAGTIIESIESVLQQTYQPLELICVDNNSTDGTYEVIKAFQEKGNQNIVLLKEERKGAPFARNTGLEHATGDYIQFLDADDLLFPGKIAHQINLAKINSFPDLIAGSLETLKVNGTIEKTILKEQNVWYSLMLGAQLGITSSNLFKKQALLEVGKWDTTLKSSQEYDLMFRVIKNGGRVIYDQAVNTQIRQSVTGISFSSRQQNAIRRMDLRIKILEHLKQTDLWKDSGFRQNIQQIFFEKLKSVYLHDKNLSLTLFNQYLKGTFQPTAMYGTSGKYLLFYKLLGFKLAQLIYYKK